MFTVELKAGSRTEYLWDPKTVKYVLKQAETEEAELDGYRQTLMIRRAVIGPSAKENETNLVSVEVEDTDAGQTDTFPLVYLTKGSNTQALVDLTFPEQLNVKVKFILLAGSGPVHLIGYHFVEKLPADDPDYVSEADEDLDAEGDEIDTEEELSAKVLAPIIQLARQKRRIQTDQNGGLHTKKMKVGSENGNGDGNGEAAPDEDMEKEAPAEKAEAAAK